LRPPPRIGGPATSTKIGPRPAGSFAARSGSGFAIISSGAGDGAILDHDVAAVRLVQASLPRDVAPLALDLQPRCKGAALDLDARWDGEVPMFAAVFAPVLTTYSLVSPRRSASARLNRA